MKRAPRSRQRHDLYAKYHDYDSEISDLLGECGLAMFLTKGKWPEFEVDHINGNKLDNRMVNLRDVNHSVNMRNQNIPHKRKHTNSGYIGVSYHKASGKWSATLNYKNVAKKHIGIYDTPEEAYGYYFAAKLDHEWKRRK